MNRRYIGTLLPTLFLSISSFAGEMSLSKNLLTSLDKYDSGFTLWKISDYTPTIQESAAKEKRFPYSLIYDFNADGIDDYILCGHDNENEIILSAISNNNGYVVQLIRKVGLGSSKDQKHFNDNGEEEIGLHYYLWPDRQEPGFSLGYPQEGDSEGNLISDGGLFRYVFKDGKFEEEYIML